MIGLTDGPVLDGTSKAGIVAQLLGMMRNPVTAITLIAVGLIYFLGTQVLQGQRDMSIMLTQHQIDTATLRTETAAAARERLIQTSILRQICIGVNKGASQVRCGDDR